MANKDAFVLRAVRTGNAVGPMVLKSWRGCERAKRLRWTPCAPVWPKGK